MKNLKIRLFAHKTHDLKLGFEIILFRPDDSSPFCTENRYQDKFYIVCWAIKFGFGLDIWQELFTLEDYG